MAVKVLVVDDEKDIVELVRYHLEKEGFRCLAAPDGPTALRLIREQRPDLLVLVRMLPGLDGWRYAVSSAETRQPPRFPSLC